MNHRLIALVITAIIFNSVTAEAQTGHKSRTWKDKSGSYSIEATFVEEDGKIVKLKTGDGEIMEIALDQLSEGDQYYVKELKNTAADSPFKKASPFQKSTGKSSPSGGMTSASDADAATSAPMKGSVVSEDMDEAEDMLLTPMISNQWEFPSITPIASQGKKSQTTIRLPESTEFFERFEGMATNPTCQHAIVGYNLKAPGRDKEATTRLVLCDLVKGKFGGAGTLKGLWVPVAIQDDGQTVLLMSNDTGFGGNSKLHLVQLTKSGVESIVKWTPFDSLSSNHDKDIRFVKFVGTDKIVTSAKKGDIVIWSYPAIKPLARVSAEFSISPSVTSDGRYMLFSRKERLGVIDLQEEKIIANHDLPFTWINKVTVNPSGNLIVVVENSKLSTFSAQDLTKKGEFYFTSGINPSDFDWVDDRYLVLGKSMLFDVEAGLEVWTFEQSDSMFAQEGMIYSTAKKGNKVEGIVAFPVPDAEITKAVQTAQTSGDFFLLTKGSDISVDASGIQDGGQQQNVKSIVEGRLKEAGFNVTSSAPTKVLLSSSQGESREVEYRMFGGGNSKGTFTPFNMTAKFQNNGQDIYVRSSSSGIPPFIHLQQGESVQDYANKVSKPNYEYFKGFEIPLNIPRPRTDGKRGFGTTTFTLR